MVKKWSIFIAFLLVLSNGLSCSAAEIGYKKYLDEEQKIVMISAKYGMIDYLNLASLGVKEYEPPIYSLVGKMLVVDANEDYAVKDSKWQVFQYDHARQRIRYRNDQGSWVLLDPLNSEDDTLRKAAEMLFYEAYHKDFYKKYYYIENDNIYKRED